MIRTLEKLQGRFGVIKLLVNQKELITISVMVGNWSDDVVCLINLLLSTKVCSSMIFELGWQQQENINHNCKLWIQCAIESSVNMFQIFKWELLDGVELSVLTMPEFRKSKKDSFLDIEIDPMAYVNRWTKADNEYIFPQKNLYVTTDTIKFDTGQSSWAPLKDESLVISTKEKAAIAKGKEKVSEEKATLFVDLYQDAQEQQDHTWETKYLEWLNKSWQKQKLPSSSSEFDPDVGYDSDQSSKGPL